MKTALPGAFQLFAEVRRYIKGRGVSLIGLWILWTVVTIGLLLATEIIISAALRAFFWPGIAIESANDISFKPAYSSFRINYLFLVALLAPLASMMIGSPFLGAVIVLVTAKNKISFREALRRGRQKWGKLAWGVYSLFFLISGGLAFFVVPGLILLILLGLVMHEVILSNVPVDQAFNKSAGMVKQHFWAVVSRLFFFILLVIAGIFFLRETEVIEWSLRSRSNLLATVVGGTAILLGLNILWVVFWTVLHRHLKSIVRPTTPLPRWSGWVVFSWLGWTLVAFMYFMFFVAFSI